MKKLLAIFFIVALLAPSLGKWAAYIHCVVAAENKNDCGCGTAFYEQNADKNNHEPITLTQQYFSDWNFEIVTTIQLLPKNILAENICYNWLKLKLEKGFSGNIFRPPIA